MANYITGSFRGWNKIFLFVLDTNLFLLCQRFQGLKREVTNDFTFLNPKILYVSIYNKTL